MKHKAYLKIALICFASALLTLAWLVLANAASFDKAIGPSAFPVGKGGAAVADCPVGTYLFAWDGLHADGSTVACFADGASSAAHDATEGTYTIASGVMTTDNNDERFTHNATGDDIIADQQGTVWFSVYVSDGADRRVVWESNNDPSNFIYIEVLATEALSGHHRGSGGGNNIVTSAAISTGTWVRAAYSWQTGVDAGGTHAICVGANCWATPDDDDTEDLDAWSSDPNDVTIGENDTGLTFDEEIKVKDVYITSGYKDADPAP
jgi:hypothetical protein